MDMTNFRFADPAYLRLLAIPALILCVWLWRFFSRRSDIAKQRKNRIVPVKEKYLSFGPLMAWLFLIPVIVLSILSLSKPQRLTSIKNDNSVDLVIVQDGSASMYVKDSKPDRWNRSMGWIRTLVETLAWRGDRIALAAFAHQASPMIRITSDPNVVLFFLDHLKQSPFSLNLGTTWDTNVEEGLYWGVKILERDFKLRGRSKNPQAFVVISDGQVWSGRMEAVVKIIRTIGPVYVIGVGTTSGEMIPQPKAIVVGETVAQDDEGSSSTPITEEPPRVHSSIDRPSLRNIAAAGGGEYFELGTESDVNIALKIINRVKMRGSQSNKEEAWQDLYWYCLVGAAAFLCLAVYSVTR